MREAKDRSNSWLIEHHASSFLCFGGVSSFSAYRAVVLTAASKSIDVSKPGVWEREKR